MLQSSRDHPEGAEPEGLFEARRSMLGVFGAEADWIAAPDGRSETGTDGFNVPDAGDAVVTDGEGVIPVGLIIAATGALPGVGVVDADLLGTGDEMFAPTEAK